MVRFEADGFSPFLEIWQKYDWLRGRQVAVETVDGLVAGVVEGIDADGALLLCANGERRRFTSGSVLLSKQPVNHP
jgi:biotin-(acetyl-CoA carboxylase) ligase